MTTESILRSEEGKELKLYKDTKDVWTIGIGYNIQERGLPDDICEELFRRDMMELKAKAARIPEYHMIDTVRQGVLERMVYQMGLDGTLAFKNMRRALAEGRWHDAYSEMLDSQWFVDTPARCRREANRMLRGIE